MSPKKSQLCGQVATHDGMFPLSPFHRSDGSDGSDASIVFDIKWLKAGSQLHNYSFIIGTTTCDQHPPLSN